MKKLKRSFQVLQMFMNGKKTFAVEYAGKVVGSLGIEIYREDHYPQLAQLRGREIGYALAKDCWGKGLMTEAVQAMLKHGFGNLGLDRISVTVNPDNDKSLNVIRKCGFTYEGTLRQAFLVYDGSVRDIMCFSISREEYYGK